MLMSFQFSGASVAANQISSENTLFCSATSALCVSMQPTFGFNMLTFTCFTFVSMIIIYAMVYPFEVMVAFCSSDKAAFVLVCNCRVKVLRPAAALS